MKMNTREKLLIILLSALVILLGGFKLLIEPSIKKLSELDTMIGEADMQKAQLQSNIFLAQSIEQRNIELEEEIKLASKPFLPSIENNKLQKFFQDIAAKTGIEFTSFIMTDKVASTVINHTPSLSNGVDYPAKDAASQIDAIKSGQPAAPSANASNGDSTPPQETANSTAAVELTTVSFQTTLTYQKLNELIDTIKKSERTIRISALTIAPTAGSGTAVAASNLLEINISVECFGVEKINSFGSEDSISKDTLPTPSGKDNPFS